MIITTFFRLINNLDYNLSIIHFLIKIYAFSMIAYVHLKTNQAINVFFKVSLI